MLNVPHGDNNDGTDQKPLILPDEEFEGWELLLSSFYRMSVDEWILEHNLELIKRSNAVDAMHYTRQESIAILRIAHKYLMEKIEEDMIKILSIAQTTSDLVDLMVASQITGSDTLYKQAMDGLASSNPPLTLDQARLIGLDALYALFIAQNAILPRRQPILVANNDFDDLYY